MQYFDSLPKAIKTKDGVSILMTDLMARCSIIPEILKNPMLYYEYTIQDGDTPEIVAYKYYGDSYRYWIVLFANQINACTFVLVKQLPLLLLLASFFSCLFRLAFVSHVEMTA
jgi:hypothetical protein